MAHRRFLVLAPTGLAGPPVIAPFPSYLKAMRPDDILLRTSAGLCCKVGGFHIDPTRAVDKAVITHGHSDHARAGHGAVLATQETLDLMRRRYGEALPGAFPASTTYAGTNAPQRRIGWKRSSECWRRSRADAPRPLP
jgi:hypothetical protein